MQDAIALAGLLLLNDYYSGGFVPRPEVQERVRELLHPFAGADGLLTPILNLEERMAELEPLFPRAKRAAHLTRMLPMPC